MKENWETALAFVLKHEGGYVNNPKDPGGETNFGITKKSYPNLDIKKLTVEKATEIYCRDFWLGLNCNNIQYPLDLCFFNCAVNCGPGTAKDLLSKYQDWRDFLIGQIRYYRKCDNAKYFLDTWLIRTIELWKLINHIS